MRWLAFIVFLLSFTASSGPRSTTGGDDDAELRRMHELVLQAHRAGEVAPWLAIEADSYVVARRGELDFPTKSERREARSSYLGSTRFASYRDLREPIVMVSKDGSLGWLIAQVEATGVQALPDGTEQPLHFISAWIELYRKGPGGWRMVGNVSNFRPEGRDP